MPNANIVDHIGSKVTVWTKDGNAAENRILHTVDEFGLVISNQHGQQTFIPWVQVKYVDYENGVEHDNQPGDKLPQLTTKLLSAELSKRAGVDTFMVEPYLNFAIIIGDQQYKFTGPATILVNQD